MHSVAFTVGLGQVTRKNVCINDLQGILSIPKWIEPNKEGIISVYHCQVDVTELCCSLTFPVLYYSAFRGLFDANKVGLIENLRAQANALTSTDETMSLWDY